MNEAADYAPLTLPCCTAASDSNQSSHPVCVCVCVCVCVYIYIYIYIYIYTSGRQKVSKCNLCVCACVCECKCMCVWTIDYEHVTHSTQRPMILFITTADHNRWSSRSLLILGCVKWGTCVRVCVCVCVCVSA